MEERKGWSRREVDPGTTMDEGRQQWHEDAGRSDFGIKADGLRRKKKKWSKGKVKDKSNNAVLPDKPTL
jgi:hypothetical protein